MIEYHAPHKARARKLYQFACTTKDPHGTIARWLSQELNHETCITAILALYQLTGEFYIHPETPTPTLHQKARTPHIWLDAVGAIRRFQESKIDHKEVTHNATDKLSKYLLSLDPIEMDETPDAQMTSTTWCKSNGVKRSPYDRPRAPSSTVGCRFVPPTPRGQGRHKKFSIS